MDTANFQSVKNSFLQLPEAEQSRIAWAWLWRVTRARSSAINTQVFYNIKREIETVCNNAGARDDQPKLIGFGVYKNIYLTQEQYDQLVAEHGQDVVVDALTQLSDKLNAGEYQTTNYLRACRDFIKTEKLFRGKHGVPVKVDFTRHNYSAETLQDQETNINDF